MRIRLTNPPPHHEGGITLIEVVLATGPYLIVLGTKILDRRKKAPK